MNMRQYFNNFLTLLKIGESGGSMLFNGNAVAPAVSGGDIAIVSVIPADAVVGTLYGIPNADYPAPTIVTAASQSFLASEGLSNVPITIEEFSGFVDDVVISYPYDAQAFAPTSGGSGANRTYSIAAGSAKSGSLTLRATTIFGKTAQQTISIVAASQFFTITGSVGGPNGTIPASTIVAEGGEVTITPTPASGYVAYQIVIDGGTPVAASSWTFTDVTANHTVVAYFALNTAPTISNISNQSTNASTPTGAIAFTVGDDFTPAGNLTVSATSSDQSVITNANLVFGGSGENRTITCTPNGIAGSATITMTVSDGSLTTSDTFVLTVGLSESVFYDSTPITVDGVLSGIYNFNTTSLNKSGVAFIPTATADITKIALRLTSRGASIHNTANTIRCRIFADNGSGLPNIGAGALATATAAGISAADTIFTPVFTFATSADNFAGKISFASGVKKHFVFDIPAASGNTAYSIVGQDSANASYPEQSVVYTSDSAGTIWVQNVWEPKCIIHKVA